jgi:hypothetical protein
MQRGGEEVVGNDDNLYPSSRTLAAFHKLSNARKRERWMHGALWGEVRWWGRNGVG